MNRGPTAVAWISIAAGLALAACSSAGPTPEPSISVSEVGPLIFSPEAASTVCTSASRDRRLILATHVEIVAGHEIRINAVTGFNPVSVHVEANDVVPIVGTQEMLIENIPPRPEFRAAWQGRSPAVGARVAWSDHVQLASTLQVSHGQGSSLDGLTVMYTDLTTGRAFEVRTNLSLRTNPESCVP